MGLMLAATETTKAAESATPWDSQMDSTSARLKGIGEPQSDSQMVASSLQGLRQSKLHPYMMPLKKLSNQQPARSLPNYSESRENCLVLPHQHQPRAPSAVGHFAPP
eukprot:Hpha_TRINITY_DN30329_c0_g1::TRINITY_DN30329_c0_g1_i1::g.147135::m.147135